jgi:hypothetical protein
MSFEVDKLKNKPLVRKGFSWKKNSNDVYFSVKEAILNQLKMKNGKIKESFILALETKMCNCINSCSIEWNSGVSERNMKLY